MAYDYTQWPDSQAVLDRLASAGLTLRDTSGRRMQAAIDEVTGEVPRRTLRNFIADTVDASRTYDGQGTAELEIDEIVSLTSVQVTGLQAVPTYALSGVSLVHEQNKPVTRIVVAQGSVPAFTTAGVFAPYPLLFPAGRQNIVVTGKFGYGATVPTDLWNAVCGEIAHRLASECIFDNEGRLKGWTQDGVTENYALPDADDLKWHGIYLQKIVDYKRPSGRRLRNLRTRMI